MSNQNRKGYTGGKSGNGVFQTLINLIPPHNCYIEPFLGNGAILRNKRPAALNVGIDRDRAALRLFDDFQMNDLFLIEGDALELLSTFAIPRETFIFVDAPYLESSRRSKYDLYNFEFKTEPEHRRLFDLLKSLPAKILVTHYENDFYSEHLADWQRVEFFSYDRAGNRRTENAFFNYPKPAALHDYRYLGANFREREKITRKQRRWKKRLENMSLLERQAMFSVIEEVF